MQIALKEKFHFGADSRFGLGLGSHVAYRCSGGAEVLHENHRPHEQGWPRAGSARVEVLRKRAKLRAINRISKQPAETEVVSDRKETGLPLDKADEVFSHGRHGTLKDEKSMRPMMGDREASSSSVSQRTENIPMPQCSILMSRLLSVWLTMQQRLLGCPLGDKDQTH